jgi:hypothetical protein
MINTSNPQNVTLGYDDFLCEITQFILILKDGGAFPSNFKTSSFGAKMKISFLLYF